MFQPSSSLQWVCEACPNSKSENSQLGFKRRSFCLYARTALSRESDSNAVSTFVWLATGNVRI